MKGKPATLAGRLLAARTSVQVKATDAPSRIKKPICPGKLFVTHAEGPPAGLLRLWERGIDQTQKPLAASKTVASTDFGAGCASLSGQARSHLNNKLSGGRWQGYRRSSILIAGIAYLSSNESHRRFLATPRYKKALPKGRAFSGL